MEVKEAPKCQETSDPEDRISLLPDSLIIDEILSRLDSTKYAIRTGILSKRWQHLWPSVPLLRFDPFDFDKTIKIPDFYMSVDKTLTQCRPRLKKLNKFHVWTAYESRFESQVNNWIRFVTGCNVEQVFLNLRRKEDNYIEDDYVLQGDSFFVNSHFTDLHFGYCRFNPTGPISWNNLTNLSISDGKLDQDLIANILSGSPALHTLRLFNCYGFSRLDITSKSVKDLTFDGYATQDDDFDDLDQTFEVNAPYISSLRIIDYLLLCKILLRDVSSLVEVHLGHGNYDIRFESYVSNWIHFASKSKVKRLKVFMKSRENTEDEFVLEGDSFFINSHFTNLNLGYCRFNPIGRITWNNLTDLTIYCGKLDQDLIANILSGSPLLETLRLNRCYGYSCLDITSKSVKNLVFCGYSAQDDESDICDHVIEINAPYISSLKIIGILFLWKIVLQDVSSLVKAELDYMKLGYYETTRKEENEMMLIMFILRLHHVKQLKIGKSCYTAFSRLEAKGLIFPSNLKVVEVTYPGYESDDSMELDKDDSTELDSDDSTELGDCSDNDSSVCDSSGCDLQSNAAMLGLVQATQQVIMSEELATYAPPQVLMPDDEQDAEQ